MHVLLIIVLWKDWKVWKTNIDIQPVFIHPKAVTYTCACSIKAEDKT